MIARCLFGSYSYLIAIVWFFNHVVSRIYAILKTSTYILCRILISTLPTRILTVWENKDHVPWNELHTSNKDPNCNKYATFEGSFF